MWTPFYESINDLLHLEKKARQENDAIKSAEVCCQIVSFNFKQLSKWEDFSKLRFNSKFQCLTCENLASKSIWWEKLRSCLRMAPNAYKKKRLGQTGDRWVCSALHQEIPSPTSIKRNCLQFVDCLKRGFRGQDVPWTRIRNLHEVACWDVRSRWQNWRSM